MRTCTERREQRNGRERTASKWARALTTAVRRPPCYIDCPRLTVCLESSDGERRGSESRSGHRSRCWLHLGGPTAVTYVPMKSRNCDVDDCMAMHVGLSAAAAAAAGRPWRCLPPEVKHEGLPSGRLNMQIYSATLRCWVGSCCEVRVFENRPCGSSIFQASRANELLRCLPGALNKHNHAAHQRQAAGAVGVTSPTALAHLECLGISSSPFQSQGCHSPRFAA